MELRLQVDDEFMRRLQDTMGAGKATDITREALTLLNWAVDERAKGRVILSADPKGKEELVRLAMPSLEKVPPASSKAK